MSDAINWVIPMPVDSCSHRIALLRLIRSLKCVVELIAFHLHNCQCV